MCRGCPKAYHKACIKRDDAFFSTKAKWICGMLICKNLVESVNYHCVGSVPLSCCLVEVFSASGYCIDL